jgi:hypothetical protein
MIEMRPPPVRRNRQSQHLIVGISLVISQHRAVREADDIDS